MEKITMDSYEMQSLSIEVFYHLIYAKRYEPTVELLQHVLDHYNTIIECPEERLLDTIIFERQYIAKNYGSSISGISPTVYYSNVMWEYVFTMAYYLNCNDYIWKTHLLPRMKELARNAAVREDMNKAEKLVDKYIERRAAFEMDLENHPEQLDNPEEIKQLQQQIAELRQQIAAKDSRISELEKLLEHPHLTFIETEGKSPQYIQWAYQDIAKAVKKPSTMALCLVDLQQKGMLKGQERYGKLANIKSLYDELKEKHEFTWTYEALCRAINKKKKKK